MVILRRLISLVAASVLLITLAGCPDSGSTSPAEIKPFAGTYPIKVVATTGMVADLVKHVGDKHVAVTQLMGAGVDPHLYKTSPGDVQGLQNADVIFYSGLHLEGKMGDVLEKMGRKKPTAAVAERIPRASVLDSDAGHDPHVWFDVSLWAQGVTAVEEVLVKLDPPHAEEYRDNAKTYREELAKLHDWCKEQIATIPKDRRVMITAHDAFEYFGRAYDIEVRGIQGISTESEAGVLEVNKLVDLIVQRGVKAVFVETSVGERNVLSLVDGCKARGHAIKIGGELFSDAMGKPDTPEGTYPGMIKHNVITIVNALK